MVILKNIFPSLSLAFTTSEDNDVKNRNDVVKKIMNLHEDLHQVIVPKLQHGSTVEIANIQNVEPHCDAILSQESKIVLSMRLADCLPIILYDSDKHVFALLHGGWRSLLQNIIPLTIQRMQIEFQVKPSTINAWIGPSLRSCCNIVSTSIVQEHFSEWKPYINLQEHRIDLQSAAKDQLQVSGVLREHIVDSELCTYHDERFYSFRKYNKSSIIKNTESYSHFAVMAWMERV